MCKDMWICEYADISIDGYVHTETITGSLRHVVLVGLARKRLDFDFRFGFRIWRFKVRLP